MVETQGKGDNEIVMGLGGVQGRKGSFRNLTRVLGIK